MSNPPIVIQNGTITVSGASFSEIEVVSISEIREMIVRGREANAAIRDEYLFDICERLADLIEKDVLQRIRH